MSFEQDFIHGYEKHAKDFDKWCEKASSVLGNITKCGIMECDSYGYALYATNRPDFGEPYLDKKGYLLDKKFSASTNVPEGFFTHCSNDAIQFLHANEESVFGRTFDTWYGFSFSEKISDELHRYYIFCSDTPAVYDKLLNNMPVVKQFIKYFKKENEHIINYFREHKFNLAEKKDNYFTDDISGGRGLSQKERLINSLHTLGILDQDKSITNREWQCLQLYGQGKSASQTGDILGISRRTVETYFDHLKGKMRINSKSELMDIL